jgi:hypothetical protein
MNAYQKSKDDYKAKIKLYARNPLVIDFGITPVLPRFGHVRFSSYEELNTWKKEYLRSIARQGGCPWKKL